ncbi:hypothetical protein, partial [Streptomyces carminius]|uniref:hypothetical protein n=1 Tax=Streptomyces carminius TaxID=2665496 RepID=UPI0018ED9A2F
MVAFDESGEGREVTWAEVVSSPWFAELSDEHRERLRGVEEYTPVADALEQTRNTVVAAVDGGAGPEDVGLLADLHGLRGNVTAFDPVMLPFLGQQVESVLGSGNAVLRDSSVTDFGHHVPYTDVVVPHPGPWARDRGVSGLAHSLEFVLGHHSTAHILLDNEDASAEHSQSARLLAEIEAINEANRSAPEYVPLQVSLDAPAVEVGRDDRGRVQEFTELGGVRLRIRHQPPYRLVTVTRGHDLPGPGTEPAPAATDTIDTPGETSGVPVFPGVDAAWNSPGSGSRRSGSGGSGSGRRRTPVLVAFDRFGDAREVSWAEVESSAWFAELHPAHRERLRGVEDYTPIADAVEETRNTVAAAVDGGAGPEDVTLLADLYRLRRNVTAYDPVLLSSLERGVEAVLGAGRARLVRGSVTGFGRHVPYTDLVVPHPGPWARDRGPSGLAYSLEYVLGHHSTAHILLDNEVSAAENSQSVQLLAGIEEVNRRYRDVPGYVPLRAYASSPVTQSRGDRYGRVHDYTELGGVRLRIRHQPPYRLVTVTRGHSLPAAGSTAAAPTTVTTSSSYSTAYPAYPTASASSSTTTASAYPSYSATSTYPMYSTYSTGSRNSGRSGGTAYPAYSTGGSSRGPVFPGANAAWNSPD